jgi:LemA protein
MKNKGLLIVLGVLMVIFFWGCSQYNGLVKTDESVNKSWNNVQASYQKRLDQIANQVETVKGAAKFEQETLTKIIEARSKATAITLETKDLTPENVEKFRQAQNQINSEMKGSLSRLLVTVEQYPTLKANENFQMLQKSIEGLENEVGSERKNFNEEIRVYNTKVRSFPINLLAGAFGFSKREGFKADPGADKRPDVKF